MLWARPSGIVEDVNSNLTNKIAVVTGASKGIGLAIAQALAEAGAFVIGAARHNSVELHALEAAGSATFVAADLSTAEGPRALIAEAAERGGLDILVNNAGSVTPRFDGLLSVTDEDWTAAWTLNFLSAVRTTREALPHMLTRGGGAIVMIGSVNATLPEWNIVDYSATKAALANFAKSVSKEFGPKGIRVNTISPGPVSTDLWLAEDGIAAQFATVSGNTADEIVTSVVAGSATGRFTTPQEVADLAVFLAGSHSANITGADIRIDGGYVTTL
jgi:NAD(P)-dependent dehydrogenase (short-subunit alcohol dehydrogenase family)